MNTYIFIPDTNNKAGLGHFFRCLKYSDFIIKPHKIIFLIKKNFDKKFLKKNNYNKIEIKYIFYENLKQTLIASKDKNKNIITFLDSYNLKLQNLNFKIISKKHINILDFKMNFKSDYTIDHTFKRKIGYHKNKNSRFLLGIKYFPILNKLSFLKREIILINFGSVKDKLLINQSLTFLRKLNLNEVYKIVIISNNSSEKDFANIKIKNRIFFYKFVSNISKFYRRTFFSFGACGISLYEKCFYNIPSISKSLAKNQYFNFKNFNANGCILEFDRVTKLNIKRIEEKQKFFNNVFKTEACIKKKFNYKKNKKNLNTLFKKINEN
ncbi:spore coat polysaccharide biosynthesis predicted glycosyltransferase SpsG [Candidatus Pelagibacter ubique]|uniref:Spore coat polysaccharide biosynthesis predicted glycosyltransferase SpsG n=1 Tax=Pelagibacter ubique TaxID=198252 RepID=A0ABX1SZ40_PELUQ|nr:hypothetical protein [Candidatus Pelagibacter ubique]NMN67106.1 spore coat polysaccharide biosynthesis predicted glycosyltransferase SpsG [Candidatus Pelagibacter ubique]